MQASKPRLRLQGSPPRQLLSLAVLGLALTLMMLGLQLESYRRFAVARERTFHSVRVKSQLEHTLRLLVDAETGQRGFLLAARSLAQRSTTRVEVRDTGPGLPRELWETIFDPYVRAGGAKAPGLGLGLATVRRLAEGHGGSVGIAKNVPCGSLFWFDVPNVREPQPGPAPAAGPIASWARPWRARLRRSRHG